MSPTQLTSRLVRMQRSFMSAAAAAASLVAIGLITGVSMAAPAAASTTPTGSPGSTLFGGQSLYGGQHLETINAAGTKYTFAFQTDGNIVLYKNLSKVCWASNTRGSSAYRLIMQYDANLVAYSPHGVAWATNSAYIRGAVETNPDLAPRLIVQSDGNVVLYASFKGSHYGVYPPDTHKWAAVWATNTSGC